MTNPETIRAKLAENSPRLAEFGVAHLWLFGSAAQGNVEANDLDFLVEFIESPGLLNFMELKFHLESLFGKPVDLHTKASCPPRFYKRIEHELKHVA